MIQVEFIVHPNTDIDSQLVEWSRIMPWLKYLIDNQTNLDYDINHRPQTYDNIAIIKFTLPPEKETFYNLKYR